MKDMIYYEITIIILFTTIFVWLMSGLNLFVAILWGIGLAAFVFTFSTKVVLETIAAFKEVIENYREIKVNYEDVLKLDNRLIDLLRQSRDHYKNQLEEIHAKKDENNNT